MKSGEGMYFKEVVAVGLGLLFPQWAGTDWSAAGPAEGVGGLRALGSV